MQLALTSDQLMIRDAAQGFLADASASAAVRAASESATGFDAKVWERIGSELGWCGIAIPEEFGGLGLGPYELVLILEQMGRRLLCAPFFSTVCLAGNLLTQCGSLDAKKKYLPRIAAGSLIATAVFEAGLKTSGGKLSGRALVSDGASAGLLLFPVNGKLFGVAHGAAGMSATPLKTWDATRRFAQVDLNNVAAEPLGGQPEGVERAESLARLYLAAEQLGSAQQCLDLTVAYVRDRKQFGRAIASFQAVKHRCGEMMVRIEALRSAVYGCAAFAAGQPETKTLALECAMVRSLAADTSFSCAQEAIQLHGGVGFTWEYDPQLYFKRAQAASHWLGTAAAMREQIAQVVVG